RPARGGAGGGAGVRAGGKEARAGCFWRPPPPPGAAPRGRDFLYTLNRLNVATSRARGACILVASPRLFEPDCQSPRQMQLANALSRYLEMATPLQLQITASAP